MQLDCYAAYNSFLASLNDVASAEAAEADQGRFAELKEQKSATLAIDEGESLSTDDLSDIYMQVKSERRNADNFSLNTKNKDGSMADYLELRRPFGTTQ